MYAGRVACCPLVSRVEYVARDLLRLQKRHADGRETVTLRLLLDAVSVIRGIAAFIRLSNSRVMCVCNEHCEIFWACFDTVGCVAQW